MCCVSGGRSRRHFEHHDAVRSRERGLGGGVKRFKIELIAIGHGCERFADTQVRVQQLHLDRVAGGERNDRPRMSLIALVGMRRVGDRDRDRVGAAV